MFERSYLNTRTLITTKDHETAMEWYRAGDSLDVFIGNRLVLHMAGNRELGLF